MESHVVTLARSVAHLSSEMRSQHLVTQELERLRDELTALRYIYYNLMKQYRTICVTKIDIILDRKQQDHSTYIEQITNQNRQI